MRVYFEQVISVRNMYIRIVSPVLWGQRDIDVDHGISLLIERK